ncbi:MAG: glutamate--tRNA ligase [Candidatus Nealsonbacteria bacterium RBG_13_38_11]|uniref:Glutamate--tRNA ligase n=1 Tax=Candidatus Nealsonbacteria bacterium RBG_13_38_11 TaxID=1801662 RepID=A0A1G2DXZ1_9BACT|nr:MAG: glutamate--tRNA ligase [Candidatus Nealsonbacteria bacterium RBG_13_38_11]HXK31960.1 glutamate--tRNA ligase [Candidatus Paceibacterota bacterium]
MISEDFKFIKPGEVRTRIAPSPTGHFHIGSARTALFNYLFSKKHEGIFVLRIEDTDQERSSAEFEKDIMESLKWLGLNWDEGPDTEEKYGPYRQSQRTDIYKKYMEKLIAEDKVYYCFCSEQDLEAERQYQMSQGLAPHYSGQCASLDKKTVKKYLDEEKPSIIRFRIAQKKVAFEDLIRGHLEFDASLMGDMVIAKSLDSPLYNFAAVIDDFEMKISHIIRGEDHISNTPKQILLQEALDFPQPLYAHLPLILGENRTKMSKREGSASVHDFRKEGYLPEALINFMAFLGWNPGDEREIYSLPSLIKEFSLEKIQKGGAIFNIKKLDFLNGFYIRQRSPEKLAELCLPYLAAAGLPIKTESDDLVKIVSLYRERLKKLSEIVELADFFFKDKLDYEKDMLKWKEMSDKEIKGSLDKTEKLLSKIGEWRKEKLEEVLLEEAEKTNNRGAVLWPLRVALTAKEASAGPFEIAEILGKEKTLKRIKEAKELF